MTPAEQQTRLRGDVSYHVYESRVSSHQARNPAERAPSPMVGDSQAPWQAPGIDIGIRPIPVPAPAQTPVLSPVQAPAQQQRETLNRNEAEERPAKKAAIDPNAKEQDGPAGAKLAANPAPERGFVTVTTTTYPIYMHAPAMRPGMNPEMNHGMNPGLQPIPQPIPVLPPPVAMPLPPMPAPRQQASAERREQSVARNAYAYERVVHHQEQMRVNQAATPILAAPVQVAAPRPQVIIAQSPVHTPAPAGKREQGSYTYERVVDYHERVRMNQAQAPVIIAPAPAAVPRPQQPSMQTTEKRHRYSVVHDWSPVVAFAVTVIFTGFMVSLAVPFAAAAILFPTAVTVAATALFIKAAMHRLQS